MNKIKTWIIAIVFATSTGGALVATALPTTTYAAKKCDTKFITIPTWYNGLTDSKCNIKGPGSDEGDLQKFIWKIALNVINIMFQLVGYISVGFVIFGGFKFMISQGTADGAAKARQTITRAVIGLVISILAVSIVTLVGASV
ncbi:MAG: hypothetical protein L0H36_02405 [bacterium]|nr:hypothetical protein [bacterium]